MSFCVADRRHIDSSERLFHYRLGDVIVQSKVEPKRTECSKATQTLFTINEHTSANGPSEISREWSKLGSKLPKAPRERTAGTSYLPPVNGLAAFQQSRTLCWPRVSQRGSKGGVPPHDAEQDYGPTNQSYYSTLASCRGTINLD